MLKQEDCYEIDDLDIYKLTPPQLVELGSFVDLFEPVHLGAKMYGLDNNQKLYL